MSKNTKKAEVVETPEAEVVETPEAEVVETPELSIAKGKSVTSKRGILGEGKEIFIKDLAGGEDAMRALVEAGYVDYNEK